MRVSVSMLVFYVLLLWALSGSSASSLIKIAVLDGEPLFDQLKEAGVNLCKDQEEVVKHDRQSSNLYREHGTSIGLAIWSRVKNKASVCLTFYPVFRSNIKAGDVDKEIGWALSQARVHGVSIVNMSLSGIGEQKEENRELLKILEAGIKVNVAAGNDKFILTPSFCPAFPACYKLKSEYKPYLSLFTVVSTKEQHKANRGIEVVDKWEQGCYGKPELLCGSSQATAFYTGEGL